MAGAIMDVQSVHYNTPENILNVVRRVVGGPIDLDPCNNEWSVTNPKRSYMLPEHDGLIESWEGDSVFCNPPFGRTILSPERTIVDPAEFKDFPKEKKKLHKITTIADWVAKAFKREAKETFLLIPAATETTFWFDYIWPTANAICFIKGRVSFSLKGEPQLASPKGTALIYIGDWIHTFKEAVDLFDLGHVVLSEG